MDSVSRTPSDSSPASGSPFLAPGRLSDAECRRRAQLQKKYVQERERHALDKVDYTKKWKRKDEHYAEMIARLMREAADGIDEGGQLSLPDVDEDDDQDDEDEPTAASRGDTAARPAWWPQLAPLALRPVTLEELGAPPEARRLLAWLAAQEKDPTMTPKVLEGALPELGEAERKEALYWLCSTGYVSRRAHKAGRDVVRSDGPTVRESPDELANKLLGALPEPPALVPVADLQDRLSLPREWLDALVLQLAGRGSLRRQEDKIGIWARNGRLEGLMLQAIERAGGMMVKDDVAHFLPVTETEQSRTWAELHAAGEIEVKGVHLLRRPKDQRVPITAETLDRKKALSTHSTYSARSVQETARGLTLPVAMVAEACAALAADGKLRKDKKPSWNDDAGPWYILPKPGEKKPKKAAKKSPKKATKPAPKAKPLPAKKAPAKAPAKPSPAPALAEAADREARPENPYPAPLPGTLVAQSQTAPDAVLAVLREDGELQTEVVCIRAGLSRAVALGALERLLQRGLVSRSEEGGREFWLAIEEAPAAAPVALATAPELLAEVEASTATAAPAQASAGSPSGLTELSILEGLWWRVENRPRQRQHLVALFPHRPEDDVWEAIHLLEWAALVKVANGKTENDDMIDGKRCKGGEREVIATTVRAALDVVSGNLAEGAPEAELVTELVAGLRVRKGTARTLLQVAQKLGYVACEGGIWRTMFARAEAAE